MESNLQQWAGEIRARAEVLAQVTLITDFKYPDTSLMQMQCIAIINSATAFNKLLKERNDATL
jgi:hypothetical protein